MRYFMMRVGLPVVALALFTVGVRAQPISMPEIGAPHVEPAASQGALFWVVPVSIGGTTDFALEASDDLSHWQTLWNVTHQDSTNVLNLPDVGIPAGQARCFRLRVPGDSIEDRQGAWTGLGIVEYRYHYAPRIGFCNCITSATVTVRNGVVTKVADAIRATGFPEPNPNLQEFMSIDQLFDAIRGYQRSSDYLWVCVQYDPVNGFPADVLLGAKPDWGGGFTISQFEVIER